MSEVKAPSNEVYRKALKLLWEGKGDTLAEFIKPLPEGIRTWFLITLVAQSSILETTSGCVPGLIPKDLYLHFSNIQHTIATVIPELCSA